MTFGDDWTGWSLAQGQAIPDCTDGAGPCVPRADSGPAEVRLPSEAEWEFAARGGLAVSAETFAQSRFPMPDGIGRYAWSNDNAGGQVHPIGTRGASPLGLHDLYGNVSEMLLDRTLSRTPQGQTPVFIVRGGGRYDPSEKLTADLRYEVPIHNEAGRTRTSDTGFRVVVSTVGVPKVLPPATTSNAQDSGHTPEVSGGTPMRKEVEPDLTDEERREIRGQLDRLGLNAGPPPGGLWFAVLDLLRRLGIGHGPDLLGERARGALATFQKSANLEASGLVTAETRQALRVAVDALIAKELAEAERRAELERQAELVRQAEIEKQAKRDRQAEQERLARQAIVEQERQAQQAVLDLLLPMATLPAGSFDMGCQYPCDANEGPAHRVTIRGFRIGKYSVTQAQWQTIMSANPSQLKGDERPVDSVSWYEAQEFLKRLNAQFPGKPYRLPTEAEWEYAARGGLHPDYCSECASVSKGKILEWVQDCYHYNYEGAPSDGSEWRWGPCLSGNRVTRGGPWLKLDFKLDWCERVTSRGMGDPGDRYKELGLRLAQDL